MSTLFPAFLKLQNRLVTIIGGGSIATEKIPALLLAQAKIRVISPKVTPKIAEHVRANQVDWLPKLFEPSDLDGSFLVIAATANSALNAEVFEAADNRNMLCNSVDDIDHCHFFYGSIVQRGDLQIAISTNGKSPALAQRLRKELQQQFGPEYAQWLEWLGAAREILRARPNEPEATKRLLHALATNDSFTQFLRQANVTAAESDTTKAPA